MDISGVKHLHESCNRSSLKLRLHQSTVRYQYSNMFPRLQSIKMIDMCCHPYIRISYMDNKVNFNSVLFCFTFNESPIYVQ